MQFKIARVVINVGTFQQPNLTIPYTKDADFYGD